MVSLHDIERAAARIAGRVHRTPLFSSRSLGERTGTRLYFKAECLQRTGSFKVRGALNRVDSLDATARARGLIGVSAGNHAQALAYAARAAGARCIVVMPENASRTKVAASEGYGADVVLHGNVFDAFAKMEELRAQHGYTLVHPFADEAVIAGQGTVGLEIADDLPDVDIVLVPVGGGGLLSGIGAAIKARRKSAHVIGVEPIGAPAVSAALNAREVVRLERVDTIADGLAAPMTHDIVLQHAHAYVDEVVTVSDEAIRDALREILARTKLLVEPAGAAGYAALASSAVQAEGRTVAVVLSGGNVDMPRLKDLL